MNEQEQGGRDYRMERGLDGENGRRGQQERFLPPMLDTEMREKKSLAGGDDNVVRVLRQYGDLYVEAVLANTDDDLRNWEMSLGRAQDWLAGFRVSSAPSYEREFPEDVEGGVSHVEFLEATKRVSEEMRAVGAIVRAFDYQGSRAGDVDRYAGMLVDNTWTRTVVRASQYRRVFGAIGTSLPEEEIGAVGERLMAIKSNVMPRYFREQGKDDDQVAEEIESRRMGVMTDQAMRMWVEAATDKRYGNGEVPLFALPQFQEKLNELSAEIAAKVGRMFGYREEAMQNEYSTAFRDAMVASRRGLLVFRQLDLDMQFCSFDKKSSGALSDAEMEAVHVDAAKMAYFLVRLYSQSYKMDYPYDVGPVKSIQGAVHNLIQAAPMVMAAKREWIEGEKGKKKRALSMWQMWQGYGGQKGLRLDQIPFGVLDAKGTVVDEYFTAVLGGTTESLQGIPEDCFNVPYNLMLFYAWKWYKAYTGDAEDLVKLVSSPAGLGKLNKPLQVSQGIAWSCELGENSASLVERLVRLDKCNLLTMAYLTMVRPPPKHGEIEDAPMVDKRTMIGGMDILEKMSNVSTLVAWGRMSGFLTNRRVKEKQVDGKYSKVYLKELKKKKEEEEAIIKKGTEERRGVTIEESELFSDKEIVQLRKSQVFASGFNRP